MTENVLTPESRLFSYLPGIFQDAEAVEQQAVEVVNLQTLPEPRPRRPFLDRYLLPYEKILLSGDLRLHIGGLERAVAAISRLFVPLDSAGDHTPDEFLP